MVSSLSVSGGNIFAGILGSGVWRRPLSEMVGVLDQKTHKGIINQAYFKISPLICTGSIVTIEFIIPHSDQVIIKMQDMAGKEISSIVNQRLNAGSYRYFWDTHSFARGCYAVRLQAGETTCIKTIQIVQ
jgi:hypothetical protein